MTTPPNTDYVIRSTTRAPSGRSTYAIVDMAGRLIHVTVGYTLCASGLLDLVLREAVRAIPHRRVG